ncbi:hypothetical protein [Sphingobacterium sp.]|uniref:hypothetical protein n=1 Tax=Sphingobacterium sp. TaxID=341027 RepID=UPI0028A751B4|nr:hypothetical protein [Sphingobacterium sp.]
MSVKLRDPSFVRTTGRGKPKVQESTPIQHGYVCIVPRSFLRQDDRKGETEGTGKYANAIMVCIVPRSFLRQDDPEKKQSF